MMHSGYLSQLFSVRSLTESVAIAKDRLRHVPFEAIAVTGNSGTIFGGALSYAMSKPLILVRKQGDVTHSWRKVEGEDSIGAYVFVDDFADTGDTCAHVISRMKEFAPYATWIGSYFYAGNRWMPREVE